MRRDESSDTSRLFFSDIGDLILEAVRRSQEHDELPEPPASYRLTIGQEPVHLGNVEFRIMLFLASKPYHAYTRRSIAEAVSTESQAVSEDAVDEYITSLRHQLGFFHDYVQSVPYVGYRFKA